MDNSDLETSSAKTNEIKLVGWGHYDFDAEQQAAKENRPHSQKDYFTELRECENMAGIIAGIEDLVISEIVKNGFRFDGDSHQNYKYGCPIVEVDGKRLYYTVSWRHWGSIMAEAWTKIDGKFYDYMDFYMGVTEEKADFRGPIVGVHIDEEGNVLLREIDADVKKVIDGLYAEKQKLSQENSEMRGTLWDCRKVLRNIDAEKAEDIIYAAFKKDVALFCRLPEDRTKTDEGEAKKRALEKWMELDEEVKAFTEVFDKIEKEVAKMFSKEPLATS